MKLTEALKKNRKNVVIAGVLAAILAVGGISAYFTATQDRLNSWTVGKVAIDFEEPNYDSQTPEEKANITPNKDLVKDPQITNTGKNDAYVFMKVNVPKANVAAAASDGVKLPAKVQELFNYTINDGWVKVTEDTGDQDVNTYVFAYAKNGKCTALKPQEKTNLLFRDEKITFINIIEGQGLEGVTLEMPIKAVAIQTNDLGDNDATAPADVWAIANNSTSGHLNKM